MDNPRRLADATAVTAISPNPLRPSARSSEACLVVILGDDLGKRIPLTEREIVLGRSDSADLVLDLENVSRSHATILRIGNGYCLRDLESTNGTYVNDVRVHEQQLQDGDQIQIGRAMLKFLTGDNVEAQYHAEIYRLMTLDGLTQVHNKRYFDEALEREFARGQRYKHPFTLVMFDIDFFKRINDTHGHLAGDAVLRHIAARVRSKVRANDVVARVGGEEFAVILPETDLEGGAAFAEKLRQLIASDVVAVGGQELRVTVSLGVSAFDGEQHDPEALVKSADDKLYEAKRTGRDRVCS